MKQQSSVVEEVFSSIDQVNQCLFDEKRTTLFGKAIESQVKNGDHVLDVGTGSGILALHAARAGAERVTAIEYDKKIAEVARKNIEANGFSNVIDVVVADATVHKFDSEHKFDVVIMEMLTTGMIDEHQVGAINNLHACDAVKDDTKYIPSSQKTYIQLVKTDFRVNSFVMETVMHLWEDFSLNDRVKAISNKKLLNEIEFNTTNQLDFSTVIDFEITDRNEQANSVYITSESVLGADITVGDTLSLNGPVVIPIPEEILSTSTDSLSLKIEYTFGAGYSNFSAHKV